MTNRSRVLSHRGVAALLGVLLLAGAFGCADGEFRFGDPFDRESTLSQAQHRYTVLVRWNDFQRARDFVAPAYREAFMKQAEQLEDVRFTGYDSESVELDESKGLSTVRVTYTLWTPAIPYEIEITEVQIWKRDGLGNDWRVRSTFEDLQKLAVN